MITRSWVTCLAIGIFLIFCVCPCFGEETSSNETKAEEKSSPQVQQTEASKEGTTQQDSIQPSASAPTTSSSTPEGQEKKRELRLQALKTLMNQDFRYSLVAAIGNPFVPFVQPPQQKASPTELAEGAPSSMSNRFALMILPSTLITSRTDSPMGFGLIGEHILNTPSHSFL